MKRFYPVIFAVLLVGMLVSCNRNYYSSKSSRNCGCPGQNV